MGNHAKPPRPSDPGQQMRCFAPLTLGLAVLAVLSLQSFNGLSSLRTVSHSEIQGPFRDGEVCEATLKATAKATGLVSFMIARRCVDHGIGPVDLRNSKDHQFLGQKIFQPLSFSDRTATGVDQAVINLHHGAERRVVEIIESNRDKAVRLVTLLEATESLDLTAIRNFHGPDTTSTAFARKHKGGRKPLDSGGLA